MQTEKIIEKAKQLGLDTGDSPHSSDRLRLIASQVGLNEFNSIYDVDKLDKILDDKLKNKSNSDMSETSSNENEGAPTSGGRFGEAEYNAAKNKDGVYDKDYYKNKRSELDQKLEEAKAEKNRDFKKKDPNDDRPVQADGSNTAGKNKFDKLKDNVNLAKAKANRVQNSINSAKAKWFNATHPGQALKDKATQAVKNAGKNVAKKSGQAAAKAGKVATQTIGKAIGALAKNPYFWLVIGIILLILIIIIIIMGAVSGGSGESSSNNYGIYDPSCNFEGINVKVEDNEYAMTELIIKHTTYLTDVANLKGNDELIKALIVIMRTNILSYGNYTSGSNLISLSNFDFERAIETIINNPLFSDKISAFELFEYLSADHADVELVEYVTKLYEEVKGELYIMSAYSGTIRKLTYADALKINEDLSNFVSSMSYIHILDAIFSNSYENNITDFSNTNSILIGDSRVAYMNTYGIIESDVSVFAGAMGYSWFVGNTQTNFTEWTYNCKKNAIECFNQKAEGKSLNVFLWLGVNDLYNKENYFNKYLELAKGDWSNHNIYVVSVGYLSSTYPDVKNSDVTTFNNYMKAKIEESNISNLKYIDLGFTEMQMGSGTVDGVHYGKNFSREILNKIVNQFGSGKSIYSMADNCQFYNYTENTNYWWPIGSKTSNNGIIYDGSPTTTYVSSNYGYRIHPVHGDRRFHSGVDIAAGCDEVVIASRSGTVEVASYNGGYGNYVLIRHDDNSQTAYAHMKDNSLTVKVGDKVIQGQKIGLIGTTGTSTGCHLHFEIHIANQVVNPLDYISAEKPRPRSSLIIFEPLSNSRNDVQYAVCTSLLASGYSQNAVAGVLVNMEHEGGFLLDNLEDCYQNNQCCFSGTYGYCQTGHIIGNFGSDKAYTNGVNAGILNTYSEYGIYSKDNFIRDEAGYGLIQWTSSERKQGLYDYAVSKRKSIASLEVQLGYLLKEIEEPFYAQTKKYITGDFSAVDTARVFCTNFERPINTSVTCANRANNNSDRMLTYVKNGCK